MDFVWYESSLKRGRHLRPLPYGEAKARLLEGHFYIDWGRDWWRRVARVKNLSREEVLEITDGSVDIVNPATRCHQCCRLKHYYRRILAEIFPQDLPPYTREDFREALLAEIQKYPEFATLIEAAGGVEKVVEEDFRLMGGTEADDEFGREKGKEQ